MDPQHGMAWIVQFNMIILYAVLVEVRPWVEDRGGQLFFVGKQDYKLAKIRDLLADLPLIRTLCSSYDPGGADQVEFCRLLLYDVT